MDRRQRYVKRPAPKSIVLKPCLPAGGAARPLGGCARVAAARIDACFARCALKYDVQKTRGRAELSIPSAAVGVVVVVLVVVVVVVVVVVLVVVLVAAEAAAAPAAAVIVVVVAVVA